jgi:hypothetical protein
MLASTSAATPSGRFVQVTARKRPVDGGPFIL